MKKLTVFVIQYKNPRTRRWAPVLGGSGFVFHIEAQANLGRAQYNYPTVKFRIKEYVPKAGRK